MGGAFAGGRSIGKFYFRRLVVKLISSRVVFLEVDKRKFALVALGLDHASHFLACKTGHDVVRPASYPANRVRIPDRVNYCTAVQRDLLLYIELQHFFISQHHVLLGPWFLPNPAAMGSRKPGQTGASPDGVMATEGRP